MSRLHTLLCRHGSSRLEADLNLPGDPVIERFAAGQDVVDAVAVGEDLVEGRYQAVGILARIKPSITFPDGLEHDTERTCGVEVVEAAEHVGSAIAATLGAGEVRTKDMGGSDRTHEMGAAVVAAMRASA